MSRCLHCPPLPHCEPNTDTSADRLAKAAKLQPSQLEVEDVKPDPRTSQKARGVRGFTPIADCVKS